MRSLLTLVVPLAAMTVFLALSGISVNDETNAAELSSAGRSVAEFTASDGLFDLETTRRAGRLGSSSCLKAGRSCLEQALDSDLLEDMDQVREITYDWLTACNEQSPSDAFGWLAISELPRTSNRQGLYC